MIEVVLALCLTYAEPAWKPDCVEVVSQPEPHETAEDGPEPPIQVGPSVYRGMGSNVEIWRPLVAAYFAPEDVDTALCLIGYESGGNPDAKNPHSTARGLFQVLASLWAPHFGVSYDDLYDPDLNVRLAAEIHRLQGWQAWSPYNRGLCNG